MAWQDVRESRKADAALPAVRDAASELAAVSPEYGPLVEFVGAARFALLGDASHGIEDFYRERADLTKRLSAAEEPEREGA